jgi:hypothetical protein
VSPYLGIFYLCHDFVYRIGVCRGDELETEVAFFAMPKMNDLRLIPMNAPFGGNQLTVALGAGRTEGETRIRLYGHWNLTAFRFHQNTQRGNEFMAIDYAEIKRF